MGSNALEFKRPSQNLRGMTLSSAIRTSGGIIGFNLRDRETTSASDTLEKPSNGLIFLGFVIRYPF